MKDTGQGEQEALTGHDAPSLQDAITVEPAVRIEATLAPRLNLADFQNAVPLIRELVVTNTLPNDLRDVELSLHAEPTFLVPRRWRIDLLRAGQRLQLSDIQIRLDGPLFSRLTEAEQATVLVTLSSATEDGQTRASGDASTPSNRSVDLVDPAAAAPSASTPLASASYPVELLARDEWGGQGSMPEMLAAFVQPNEAYVEKLLRNAANTLEASGQSPSLNGYVQGPKQAWAIASAIWSAVCNERIAYALPPASFERSGQKVRGPARIAESRLATCLDLSLLFAAALEQAGLNPLLLLERGHAYVGVWLKDESFQTAVIEDSSALRKRIKLKEMVVFESTLVTHRPASSFSFAIDMGRLKLSEAQQEAFELCIDVRRTRLQRVRPLANKVETVDVTESSGIFADGDESGAATNGGLRTGFDAPNDDDLPDADSAELVDRANETPADRLTRWQRKLLDLSLRNNLLNFKSRKAVVLDAPDAEQLEDMLAEGHSVKLLPRSDLMEGRDPRSRTIHDERQQEDSHRQRAIEALARKEVFLKLNVDAMEGTLVDLYRTARTTLQEGGSNTLYLAFGFLAWTRDKIDSDTDLKTLKRYKAPLLMLPVTLDRRSARSGFSLAAYDDAPQFNPTLLEMLRQDFRLELGIRGEELEHGEGSLDVTGLLKKVSLGVKDIPGWEVIDEVVLSTFSFAKYLMWKDLRDRSEALKLSPVVRHLIETPRAGFPSETPFPEPRRLDADLPPQATFCPLPHDSSQLAAVLSAVRGKDFVLIGPPGTGKSQTIANLIAQCLAERKRVLFVSEKMAALDVVYRRLRDIGLGEFCLELHSSKARKTEVLSQLKNAWDASGEIDSQTWAQRADQLAELRTRLNRYVERLHHRHRNGLTTFEAIGRETRHPDTPDLKLNWASADTHDVEALDRLRELTRELDTQLQALADLDIRSNPLSHLRHTEWSSRLSSDLQRAATDLSQAAEALDRAARSFLSAARLPDWPLARSSRSAVERLARILPHAHGKNWRFVLRPDAEIIAPLLVQASNHLRQYREALDQLPRPWPRETIDSIQAGLRLLANSRDVRAELNRPWPEAICAEVEKAAASVAEYHKHERQLSVRYRPEALKLELKRLRQDWAASQKGIWPFKALKRRSVEKALNGVTEDEAEAGDIGADLEHLSRMRACRSALRSAETLGAATGGLWQDLKTDLDRLLAARRCQLAITRALQGQAWEDRGLEPVASGQCGEVMAEDLKRLRQLARLHVDLGRLDPLAAATDGVWSGLDTDSDLAETQARLNLAVHCAQDAQAWSEEGLAPIDEARAGLRATETLATLRALRTEAGRLKTLEQQEDLLARSEGLWAGLPSVPEDVDLVVRACRPLRQVIQELATVAAREDGAQTISRLPIDAALTRLLGDAEGNASLGPSGIVNDAAVELKRTSAAYESALTNYRLLWQPDAALPSAASTQDAPLTLVDAPPADVVAHCRAFLPLLPRLSQWCGWLKSREQALAVGLAPLVSAIEDGVLTPGQSRHAFEVNYCRWWLRAAIDEDELLRTFLSSQHERRIQDFRSLSDSFTGLTRQWVRAQLCAGIPAPSDLNLRSKNSEWGLLNRELQRKRAHLPLRELMNRTPTAVAALTPCLLMSPLSIAQYLPANTGLFDVVVFDEASQIPVWDAIGAMARGKQVIMVGDPKQLPPTNFFGRAEADDDEGDIDIDGDMESILDECLAANIPTISLDWHYRSRHESLIAFSNRQYYENKLITFPSPVTDDRAVSFHLVGNGIYEKGTARTNPNEARALVDELVRRLKAPGFLESKLTIGVVTFNSQQQGLIEDLLDAARREDPTLEHYFQESLLEPIFVKNLENVQGDERDIMYFSLTYGPSLAGTVSMNFGPLNKSGGERRLNVAVTRARQELRVFSSLRPDQIDLSRTQAIGVRHLKHFMEFAERGPRAFAEAVSGSVGGFDSPFEEAVSIALAARGWQVHPQIGVSGFRIDLGVVDEDAPGRYLAGVECDGASYHRSATAQDRDKVREQVLKGLGWSIVRIWSTDWWRDPAGTADRVDGQLRELLKEAREAREVAAATVSAKEAEALAKAPARGETQEQQGPPNSDTAPRSLGRTAGTETNESDEAPTKRGSSEAGLMTTARSLHTSASRSPAPGITTEAEGAPQSQEETYARGSHFSPRSQLLEFREVDFTSADVTPVPDAFFDARYDATLAALIDYAVRQEGPILERTLSRRIARAHGWLRTGGRIHERVLQIAQSEQRFELDRDERCFWPEGLTPSNCRFRYPVDDGLRDLDEVPRAELAALVRTIAGTSHSISVEAGVEAMLRHLGMKRARAATKGELAEVWRDTTAIVDSPKVV